MMATDHVFIAQVQTFKELKCGDAVELSVRSPVTGGTGKNQIPNSIEIDPRVPLFEAVGKKMVNVRVRSRAQQLELAMAIKAPALLIAVQRCAATRHSTAALRPVHGE